MFKKLFSKSNLKNKNFYIFLMIILSVIIIILAYNLYFTHKVFIGVYLNNKSVANYSYSDLYNFLEEQSKQFRENGLDYIFQDTKVNINLGVKTLNDPDLSYKLIEFDNQGTAQDLFQVARDDNFLDNLWKRFKLLFIESEHLSWKYKFDEKEWKNILQNNFQEFEQKFKAPSISFQNKNIIIDEPVEGEEFDYDVLIQSTKNRINNFSSEAIHLKKKIIKSPISFEVAESKKSLIEKILALKSISLNYKQRFWKIKSEIYKNWLIFKLDNKDKVIISFDFDKFKKYLEAHLFSDINQEIRNAKFEIKNGRVIKFQSSQDGLVLNVEQSLENVELAINNLNSEIDLAVDVVKADVETQNVNDKGIREIIGTGESNFRGSPPNRVHNIETGAKKLNGLLIAPGEEFATMKNLTPINAQSGYLPELVIKGNKTIPEYGGGLCQIGTTIYRAALHSGLKITQRRPHSYRVYYYEPAGMDATIYDPWPDMKFINDTKNYILIQTRIVGTKLFFDFWGTKDGRQVTVSNPVIYNIQKPGPVKEIETLDLKPGEKKCTESAHNGADAYFDYKVEYVDGRETYQERVRSHYIPWQAVCLVGVEKLGTNTKDDHQKSEPEE